MRILGDPQNGTGLLIRPRFPLLHFVTSDLPGSTKAPELDDTNALAALQADTQAYQNGCENGFAVTVAMVKRYLAYLIAVGFMVAPEGDDSPKKIPEVRLSQEQKHALANLEGRGAVGR